MVNLDYNTKVFAQNFVFPCCQLSSAFKMYNLTLCKLTLPKLSIIIDVVVVAFVAPLGSNVVFVVSFIVAVVVVVVDVVAVATHSKTRQPP